ncbi:MAG: hypothetical protein IJV64_11750 [Oscillospiraceae bacterium]|nr:hypothetical protein [Oscillospiraceae bacterium]
MKKWLSLLLALVMLLSLAACGSSSAPAETADVEDGNNPLAIESPPVDEFEEEEVPKTEDAAEIEAAEEPEPASEQPTPPEGAVEVTVVNNPYGLTASFYAPALAEREWTMNNERPDELQSRYSWLYKSETKQTIFVDGYFYPAAPEYKQRYLNGDEPDYELEDYGNGYEVFVKVGDDVFGDLEGMMYIYAGAFLDGDICLQLQCKGDDATAEEFTELLDAIAQHVTVGGVDETALQTESGNLRFVQYDMSIPAHIQIAGGECEVRQELTNSKLDYHTEFAAEGMSFRMYTWDIMPLSSYEGYKDGNCLETTVAGRNAKIYVGMAYGGLDSEALVELDEEHFLRICIKGEGYLDGEDLLDGMSLTERATEMTDDANLPATQVLFQGFYDDFVSAMTIGG